MGRIASPVIAGIAALSLIGLIASFGAFAEWGFIGGAEELCARIPGTLYDAHWAWLPVPVALCEHYLDSDLVVGTTAFSWDNSGVGAACGFLLVAGLWILLRRNSTH
ncbi:hypothetical protein O4220_05650 [Rhodococcus ruber]|uniref:Integral membrane protein n=1 Tax=Rhodococcus ruber TaxID=1830 RepID=A0ABT4MAJ9_9NOCA|nr:hypothetical protein [Rhodococcus ruber]MCZ4517995.1 hypothetical protein [Rhodococcus ruber]